MSNRVVFDDLFSIFNRVSPTVGLRDILVETPKESVILQRSYYAIMVLNLVYSLFSGSSIIIGAIVEGKLVENILNFADIIALTIGASISMCKSLNIYVKRNEIRELIEDLKELWPEEENDEETIKIIDDTVKPTMVLMKAFSIVEMVVPILYFFIPFILMGFEFMSNGTVTLILPFYELYPFDWRVSMWLYIACYLSQIMGGVFAGFNDPCTHGVLVAILTNLSLQCKLVSKYLSEVRLPPRIETSEGLLLDIERADSTHLDWCEDGSDQVYLRFEKIMERHEKILQLCRKFEHAFSNVLAINFFLSALIICQQIITITMGVIQDATKHVLYMSSIILQMLLPCWYSEVLANESGKISMGAYSSRWYNLAGRHKSTVLLMQMRAQREVEIHASFFFTVSLSSFIAIMKTAWSYFALLQTLSSK